MKSVMTLLIAAVLIYCGVCAVLWFAQDALIFYRQPLREDAAQWVDRLGARPMTVEHEGTKLSGWLRPARAHASAGVLLYFGGNAEEVSAMLPELHRFQDLHVALFNYRGYGESEGIPSEQTLLGDGLALYDALSGMPQVNGVIVMGRSLGTGIATHVAAHRAVRVVILISPYDSLSAVAARAYPIFPVKLLLRHPFDSASRAPHVTAPVLGLAGTHDAVVPLEHSQRLLARWKGDHQLETLQDADHYDLIGHPHFWPVVEAFLRKTITPQQ